MERKLTEAAKKGDVVTLHNLMEGNPLALKATTLFQGDSPLNIACLGGYLDFVKEFLTWGSELAADLSPDGLSPLHIASANGNLEIVKELLKVGSQLCFVKGKDGRIPLHYAVCKGRKHVIRELLSCNLECIEEMTARGENCFHLAISNNQFESFKEMVDFVITHEKGEILNKKDRHENSLLHLAAYGNQYEVFDLLLDENFYYKEEIVDDIINSLNKSGLTPLDVLLSNGHVADRELEEMVRASGGKRFDEMQATILSQQNSTVANSDNSSHHHRHQPEQQQQQRSQSESGRLFDYLKFDKSRESASKVRATLLVLAVLIGTATYQAVLSPPGGVWQDDFWPDDANSTAKQPPRHSAGEAVMGTKNPVSYGLFLFFNSMGFFMSLQIIYALASGIPMGLEIRVSLFALTFTYDTCMTTLAPAGTVSLFFVVISIVLPLIMPLSMVAARDYRMGRPCSFPSTRSRA